DRPRYIRRCQHLRPRAQQIEQHTRLAIKLGVERLLQQIFAQHELAQDLFDDGRVFLFFSWDICKAELIVEFLDGHVLISDMGYDLPARSSLLSFATARERDGAASQDQNRASSSCQRLRT